MSLPSASTRSPLSSFVQRWVFTVLATVALGAIVFEAWLVPRMLRSVEADIRGEMRMQLEVRRAAIERWIVDALADARTVAAFPSSHALLTPGQRANVDPVFPRILSDFATQHDIEAIGIFDAEHRLVGSTPWHQFSDSAWHAPRPGYSERAPEVGFVRLGSGEREVSVRVPVRGAEGCVHLAIDPQRWLATLLASRALPATGAQIALLESHEDGSEERVLGTGRSAHRPGLDLTEAMPIPGVRWQMRVWVPRAEALAPALARARAWEVGLLLLVAALVSLGYALAWGQRRAVEAAVQRSRARFSMLLEHAYDPILFLDDEGVILRCNQRAEEFYGRPAGGLTGKHFVRDLSVSGAPGSALPVDGLHAAVHRVAGGREVAVEVSTHRSVVGDQAVTVALVRDVQARLEAERQMIELNRQLRMATEIGGLISRVRDEQALAEEVLELGVSSGGMCIAAVAGPLEDGRFGWRIRRDAGPGFADLEVPLELAERAFHDAQPVADLDFEPKPGTPEWKRALHAAGARGLLVVPVRASEFVPAVVVFVARRAEALQGETRSIIENVVRDVGISVDSLRERRARQELEATLEALFESGPIGIAIMDEHDRLTEANGEFLRILGHTRESALGGRVGWTEFCCCAEQGRSTMPCELTAPFEVDFRRADGTRIGVFVGRVRLSAERPRSVAVALDLTSQRETSESLRQTQLQLLQSQKLETIGRLAGGVAHDFNNLLTVIQGYTQIVQARGSQSEADAAALAQVLRAAERAAALTRQMLAFSRQQVLEPRVLDLGQVLTDTEKMIRRLIGEDIETVMRLPGNLGHVKADPVQIEQVLLNLVVNARDAMPGGGQLTFELANFEAGPEFVAQHPELTVGEYVLLTVRDDGEGMSPEVQARIFEPFFTTKEPGKGTGLGLATVYGIIRQSGGTIWVRSARHEGTTFHILLPRVLGTLEARTGATERAHGRGETILVVEDDDMVRPITVAMLERLGYRVLSAADAAAAMALSRGRHGPIDLLLSDVVMRGQSGPELAQEFQRERPGVPVLFVTGYTHDSRTMELLSAGGIPYLAKPFSLDALGVAVRRALVTSGARVG